MWPTTSAIRWRCPGWPPRARRSVIVFAGVYFMAETAKILAPDRTVLIPEPRAGCSLADTITAQQVRDWKAEHPGAAVVAYVNTSAEVKAESDLCCTSANAAQIVASLPADREVLFLPDQFLGAYVQRVTGRANLRIWLGECHVHAGISPGELRRKADADPGAELFIHPECGCSTAALWQAGEGDLPAGRTRVLSTGGMLGAARTTTASTVLVATETGMLHQLRRANPAVRWEPVNTGAVCRYMKMTTQAALLRCLREGVAEVTVAPGVARRARRAVQAMITAGARPAGARAWRSAAGREGCEVNGADLRRLPRSPVRWERDADVVVVGSGAAGLAAALTAARHGRRVLLLSKDGVGGGATPLAQGGLAAAIGPGDSPALHQRDTLDAGAGLCDPAAVATLVSEAPGEIACLVSQGARLERTALHLEGGHSRKRIVNAGGDAIGGEVHRVLRAALLASRVQVLTRCLALDALAGDQGQVGGVLAGIPGDDGVLRVGTVTARAVVLATGGFGQAYATTTNPAGLTGDGLALAARAGAELRDVEFVQFHPTVLWQEAARGQCPLITEALRGAGAVLVDAAGQPVMAGRHPLGDLAPRDVVSAAMHERMGQERMGQERMAQQPMTQADGPGDHLWLDATGLGRVALERDFPTVTGLCRARGIDPAAEPIPVAPGAHYACGGIRAGMDGRTSVPGLFAVGEAASTGVHGANRLASNSLTEALITGRRAGELLGRDLPDPPARLRLPPAGPGVDPAARPALAAAMSRHAGVARDREGLERLRQMLGQARPAGRPLDQDSAEAASLHAASVLVVLAALARPESRGCHRWRDAPLARPDGRARHTVLRAEGGQGPSWPVREEAGVAV